MNYRKQINKILSGKHENSVMVSFALVGGIAIGAALGVLFAAKRGAELREGLSGQGRRLSEGFTDLIDEIKTKFAAKTHQDRQSASDNENNAEQNVLSKKPKSDIKEIKQQLTKVIALRLKTGSKNSNLLFSFS